MIFNPAHPGEVLKDYLGGMSVKEAAERLRVTRVTLSRILNGHTGIAAGMLLRLSAALGTSPEFWLKMQVQYDLWRARKKTPKIRPFFTCGGGSTDWPMSATIFALTSDSSSLDSAAP